jgi:hypothetical protein
MDPYEIRWKRANRIDLTLDRDKWLAVVSMVMNLGFHKIVVISCRLRNWYLLKMDPVPLILLVNATL